MKDDKMFDLKEFEKEIKDVQRNAKLNGKTFNSSDIQPEIDRMKKERIDAFCNRVLYDFKNPSWKSQRANDLEKFSEFIKLKYKRKTLWEKLTRSKETPTIVLKKSVDSLFDELCKRKPDFLLSFKYDFKLYLQSKSDAFKKEQEDKDKILSSLETKAALKYILNKSSHTNKKNSKPSTVNSSAVQTIAVNKAR